MHSIFRISPEPEKDEELKGFLLRLGALNGFMTIKELFNALGLLLTKNSFVRTSEIYTNLLSKLSHKLECNLQALRQNFNANTFLKTENNDALKALQTNSPVICISCLRDTGYIQGSWQQYHLTYCNVHHCELNTHCPECTGRFSWNADLLEGCNRCGYRWREHPSLSSRRPEYLSFIDQLDEKTEQAIFLSSLYETFIQLTQPFSFAAKKPDFNQYSNRELVEKFTLAYQLLTSKSSMLLFTETVCKELSSIMQFISFELLEKLEHPVKRVYPKFFQYNFKATETIRLTELNSPLVSEVQAGALLGINSVAVSRLSKYGHFPSISFNRSRQYDLRDIDNFMLECSKRADLYAPDMAKQFSSLAEIHTLAVKYLLSEDEALNSLLNSNVIIYVDAHPKNLSDFYVNTNDFLALISTQNDDETAHLLSYSDLAVYLCTNRLKVSEYAESFGWKPVLASRNIKKFDRFDVYKTMESYLFLNRWCGFKPYPKNGLDSYLQEHGFRPVLSVTKNTSLHVYKRTPKLIELIEVYEQLWLKLQPPRIVREQCKKKNIPFLSINKKHLTPDFQLYPYPASA